MTTFLFADDKAIDAFADKLKEWRAEGKGVMMSNNLKEYNAPSQRIKLFRVKMVFSPKHIEGDYIDTENDHFFCFMVSPRIKEEES